MTKYAFLFFIASTLSTFGFSQISGTLEAISEPVDLTNEGSADWINWGWVHTTNIINRKANVMPLIESYMAVGAQRVIGYRNSPVSCMWHDGTPVRSATNMTHGLFTHGLNNGFELRVQASPQTQMLKIVAGSFSSFGILKAWVEGVVEDTFMLKTSHGNNNYLISLNFASNTKRAKLIVRWLDGESDNFGNVTLQAAALSGAVPAKDSVPFKLSNDQKFAAHNNSAVHLKVLCKSPFKLKKIDFYNGEIWLGSCDKQPFSFTAGFIAAGPHFFRAKATLKSGAETFISDSLRIDVAPEAANSKGKGSIEGGFSRNVPATVNLSAEGNTDWSIWGEVHDGFIWHRKRIEKNFISNISKIGPERSLKRSQQNEIYVARRISIAKI